MASESLTSADNNIAYRHGIVAFVDVLGWSSVVEKSTQEPLLIGRLSSVLRRVQERVSKIVSGEGYSHGAKAHQFSDAHFLTVAIDDETKVGPEYVALWCRLLAREYLKEELLVRGGITIGQFVDNGFACFGPAITQAYQLEQQVGDPIVLIDPAPKVQEIFLEADQYGMQIATNINPVTTEPMTMNPLAKTRDGRVFIDYLRPDVSSHPKFRPHDVMSENEISDITERIRKSPSSSLKAKSTIEWFLLYQSGEWRKKEGGFLEQIDFAPTARMRRKLTVENYASVSAPNG